MKRILINATHNEEIRVALCKDNHLYDFDLENRTREQKKSNIYKGHVTRVEPSLEAVFVEYGSQRQGFLPVREIASEYLSGNPREENIKKLIKEGDELIVQVEKEERGNKGAALSTYVSLAGRYLVLMPNNPKGGGISRQISGKMRDDMKQMLRNLDMPKGMSVIIRTAGIGKSQDDLQHDLNHLLNIWNAIGEQNRNYPSPRLVHQEAGVVTRAVRDYLRDDISEIWIDNEDAFIEAETFVQAVMPKQIDKLRKYTDYEPMFARFGIEKQIETAYQREVSLPSGGSIVIDQTEALVSIDINSARSTKGADVSETAYHTNLEAADEIARQLRLRDMGGLIVIDFIDMSDSKHQKEVEKRLVDATRYDRARVQFGDISRFGLMEMSRQRLRPSLEESTGYICPRCNGNGMIRDLRSLSLSIMRQIEQIALRERHGELQAEVPTDIAAFLLNEKRESLVYLEQDSGTRITILPHAHLESPNFNLHFNHQGFAPSSYERVTDTQQQETTDRGYEVNWQTAETERPEQQPSRQPRSSENGHSNGSRSNNRTERGQADHVNRQETKQSSESHNANHASNVNNSTNAKPVAVAWLSNLFAPTPQAQTAQTVSSQDAAEAIEAIVNAGGQSRGMFGNLSVMPNIQTGDSKSGEQDGKSDDDRDSEENQDNSRKSKGHGRKQDKRSRKSDRYNKKDDRKGSTESNTDDGNGRHDEGKSSTSELPKREPNSRRESRGAVERGEPQRPKAENSDKSQNTASEQKDKTAETRSQKHSGSNAVNVRVNKAPSELKEREVVHLSLDNSKPVSPHPTVKTRTQNDESKNEAVTKPSASEQKASDTDSAKTSQVVQTSEKENKVSADDKLVSFTEQDIFSERYVTAQKFGQASNDPRVVKANMLAKADISDRQYKDGKSENATAKTTDPVISGTVGTFITTVLEDGASRIQADGVIASFLQALSVHQQSSAENTMSAVHGQQIQSADEQSHGKPEAIFSFVNYGYDPLSTSYVTQFAVMTSPVAQTQAEQGKTEVMPRPVGKRASNDPRGQHPDYQPNSQNHSDSQSNDDNDAKSEGDNGSSEPMQNADAVQPDDTASQNQSQTTNLSPIQAMQELLSLTSGQLIERILGDAGKDLIASGQTEVAFLQALNQPFDVLMSVANQTVSEQSVVTVSVEDVPAQPVEQATDIQPATALTSESHSEEIAESRQEQLDLGELEEIGNTSTEVSEVATKSREESHADKPTQTTPETYRSMIENVAGQMASGTASILNLVAPKPKKVPSSRRRKADDDKSE